MKDYTIIICEETIEIPANYQMGGERKGGRKKGITLSVACFFFFHIGWKQLSIQDVGYNYAKKWQGGKYSWQSHF